MPNHKSPPLSHQVVRADPPHLTIAAEGNPVISVDARLLDTMEIDSDDVDGYHLVVEIGDLRVCLYMAGGVVQASDIERVLSQYTRNGTISSHEAYVDAQTRLQSTASMILEPTSEDTIDITSVYQENTRIHVLDSVFLLSDVEHYAEHAANIPLGHGRAVQAALALLIARTRLRAEKGDDIERLQVKISDYESRIK